MYEISFKKLTDDKISKFLDPDNMGNLSYVKLEDIKQGCRPKVQFKAKRAKMLKTRAGVEEVLVPKSVLKQDTETDRGMSLPTGVGDGENMTKDIDGVTQINDNLTLHDPGSSHKLREEDQVRGDCVGTDSGIPKREDSSSRAKLEPGRGVSLKGMVNPGVSGLVKPRVRIGDFPEDLVIQKAANINYKLMEGARRLKELRITPEPKYKSRTKEKRLTDGGPLKQTQITSFKAKWRALKEALPDRHKLCLFYRVFTHD